MVHLPRNHLSNKKLEGSWQISCILLATQKLIVVPAWPGLEREEKEAGEWTRILRVQERKQGRVRALESEAVVAIEMESRGF